MPNALVVDDCPHIRKLLRMVLEFEHFTVQEAEHGGPALDIMRASKRGLVVLLGLVMPYMPYVNGEEVLETVAADEALAARHAIIMVTGSFSYAATGHVAELRERLDVPLIRKPFTMDEILEAADEVATRLAAEEAAARMKQGVRVTNAALLPWLLAGR